MNRPSTSPRRAGRSPFAAVTVWLVVMWLALWGEVTAANVIGGLAVAVVVLIASPLETESDRRIIFRPRAALRFAGYFAVQMLRSNLLIAREVLRREQTQRSGVIAVPMRGLSNRLVTLVSNAYTLTPGSITIEVLGSPPVVYVHLLRVDDADSTRRQLLHLEYLAVLAFGTVEARELLESEGVS